MSNGTKIATCCYCGTRAALVLRGKARHELSCASCGAPLHDMKMLRSDALRTETATTPVRPSKTGAGAASVPVWERKKKGKSKKRKKPKSLARKLFSEAFDVIEDIFD